ncbi:MAG TPA: family 20 glycosylhydrolase [Fimbriimonas sp.]|nr:family 20 glycosylhydrolase [Fimbriimonas sp.]
MLPALALLAANLEPPAIVPWPHSLSQFVGQTALSQRPTIAVKSPSLRPLAQELAREIHLLTGVKPKISNTRGQIILALDSFHKGEAFQVDTRGPVKVSGSNYAAVAMGTSELIQCMSKQGTFPRLLIEDKPLFGYRGLMLDVARKPHPIAEIRKAVMLCHLYRVRYLQLHMTDDQGWTFPSSNFPALGMKNESYEGEPPSPLYSHEDLRGLVAYADLLGVTIIPEIDTPGHTAAMRRAQPEPFAADSTLGTRPDGVLDVLNPKAVDGVKQILTEAEDLFHSPYMHLGGDEAEIGQLKNEPTYAQRLEQGNFEGPWDLFLQYINDLSDHVRSHDKTPIVWEFYRNHLGHNIRLPKGSIIMAWEGDSNGARMMLDNGYSVINVPWTVGYRSDPRQHYFSNPYDVNGVLTKPSDSILGLQLNVWESTPVKEWPSLRASLPARMETVWHYPVPKPYEDFQKRFKRADEVFGLLANLH